jgi:SAM-dependent methyltransferase
MKLPLLDPFVQWLSRAVGPARFEGSRRYWKKRYAQGGTSGAGSYGRLAEFKAEVLNGFVRENDIRSVIEFGCGDGNQLTLAAYPRYLGFDVTAEAVAICRSRFGGDSTKEFRTVPEYRGERAELALSLDVIFHLVEDDVFDEYMKRLFASAERFVVVYSSDRDEQPPEPHVRHRCFTRWIATNAPGWRLRAHVPNRYPYRGDVQEGSFADFFIYERVTP